MHNCTTVPLHIHTYFQLIYTYQLRYYSTKCGHLLISTCAPNFGGLGLKNSAWRPAILSEIFLWLRHRSWSHILQHQHMASHPENQSVTLSLAWYETSKSETTSQLCRSANESYHAQEVWCKDDLSLICCFKIWNQSHTKKKKLCKHWIWDS